MSRVKAKEPRLEVYLSESLAVDGVAVRVDSGRCVNYTIGKDLLAAGFRPGDRVVLTLAPKAKVKR